MKNKLKYFFAAAVCCFFISGCGDDTKHPEWKADLSVLEVYATIATRQKSDIHVLSGTEIFALYTCKAVLSVDLEQMKRHGSKIILPQPKCTISIVDHQKDEVFLKNSGVLTLKPDYAALEKKASENAQMRMKKIADSETYKKIARVQTREILKAIYKAAGEEVEIEFE